MPIRLTRTVRAILIFSFAVFLVQQTADLFLGAKLHLWLSLVPSLFWNQHAYWQILTYSFVQRDVMQLFFNFLMIAFIGSELEVIWGGARFLKYYLFCATLSGIAFLVFQAIGLPGAGDQLPLMGASGAIYGLLTAYGILFGERVLLFMMLFPMKAKHFVWVLGLLELLTTFYSSGGAATSFVLLAGMLGGAGYLWVRARLSLAKKGAGFKKRKLSKSDHLKLVVNNKSQGRGNLEDDDSGGDGKPRTWH